ncbi:MAG: MFS transporter [Marinoscillum sp.]
MKLLHKLTRETSFFKQQPKEMQVLLMTNMIYAFVLPVIEIFVGAYIMRSSNDPKIVALYQLTVYTGIPVTFLINGYLLRWFRISNLYSFGMLLSGASMFVMMGLESLSYEGVATAGFLMGASFGFFWANRDYLALGTTNDQNRNYYYGLETFFYTITAILVPLAVGWFLGAANKNGWFGGQMVQSYRVVSVVVVGLTILSSIVIHRDKFKNPTQNKFLYFRFDQLWNKLMALAGLKGMVQGYLVTAPAILIMRLVGDEGSLGLIQGVSGAFTAIMLYLIGRTAKPHHRIAILSLGLIIFTIGTLVNGLMFSSVGVMVFVLCKVLFQPLHDIAYFPIQMRVIDVVSAKEKRNEFAYIFNHEFGLYLGRFFGLGLFIALASYVSETFALKYSLIVVAVLQLLSIPLAKHITRQADAYEGKTTESSNKEPLIAVAANETTI